MDIETVSNKYRLNSLARGLSPKTIKHTLDAVGYFADFLGGIEDVRKITGDDLRRFIIALQQKKRWAIRPDIKAWRQGQRNKYKHVCQSHQGLLRMDAP